MLLTSDEKEKTLLQALDMLKEILPEQAFACFFPMITTPIFIHQLQFS